jgi:hypothetical protein
MAWLLFMEPPARVLQLGLGAAALTKWCWKQLPQTEVVVVEQGATVIAACRRFFALPEDDARLEIVHGDAGEFVAGFERDLRALPAPVWAAALAGARAAARAFPMSMSEAFLWEWAELGRRSFRPQRRVDDLAALARVRPVHVLAALRALTDTTAGARVAAVDVVGKGRDLVTPSGAAAPDNLIDELPT